MGGAPPHACLPQPRRQVVKVRAESMAAAAAAAGGRPHGMLSVVGLGDAELAALCGEAAGKLGPGTVCEVANRLFPTVRGRRRAARPGVGCVGCVSHGRAPDAIDVI